MQCVIRLRVFVRRPFFDLTLPHPPPPIPQELYTELETLSPGTLATHGLRDEAAKAQASSKKLA